MTIEASSIINKLYKIQAQDIGYEIVVYRLAVFIFFEIKTAFIPILYCGHFTII